MLIDVQVLLFCLETRYMYLVDIHQDIKGQKKLKNTMNYKIFGK